ncbi:MAG: multicopper oxidase domain-containing protein [Acidobacteriota bacterium]
MYYNVLGEKVSKARYREMIKARKNRQELIAAGMGRRDFIKMGLVTGAGVLVAKSGISARAESLIPVGQPASSQEDIRPFVEPLPIPPIKQPVPSLHPAPTVEPNTAAGEGRQIPHQALHLFPPEKFYEVRQRLAEVRIHPDLPRQRLWGFDGMVPGPTYVARYGEPILVRNFNNLPANNEGFGLPSVSTHLHNGHTPSESDGNPCDFFERGKFYDQHYPNVLAGVLSTHQAEGGDINEALSTLWYHDHRVDHTAQNVYKGLYGFYLLFNEKDNGDETNSHGFRLPSFPEFDIRMDFADKVLDEDGKVFFDLFNLDGIIGDTFLVNGKVQPVLKVKPRRYRFRWLDAGPSRFYQLFFTDLRDQNRAIPFWHISNDGNLLPRPIQVTSARIGVAERHDVIIDFRPFRGKTIFLENRLKQVSGFGPVPPPNDLHAPGRGNLLVKIEVDDRFVPDHSADPAQMRFYDLPDKTETPRIQRTFKFNRFNGQWTINDRFMNCDEMRFRIKKNSVEHWVLMNLSGDWEHPIHIHLEEHQILSRQLQPVSAVERARKDVSRLVRNEHVRLFFRFRDFTGKYPLHCHNTIHEDHAMMLLWEVTEEGDGRLVP